MSGKTRTLFLSIFIPMMGITSCTGPATETEETAASAESAPSISETPPEEQVTNLEAMCSAAADEIAERQTQATLYQRVGGRSGLHEMVSDTVARHQVNEQISHFMEGVDAENLTNQVTDFLVVGTGGEGEYNGRDMLEAHAHLKLSNMHFLAAGEDMDAAMKAAGWGAGEQQELLCAFVALRSEVVTQ